MVHPTLLPLMRTTRLPVVDWTDAPRRFKWTRPFRRKTKSGFCACAITVQLACITGCNIHKIYILCVTSCFSRAVDENCALLGCYVASSGNFLQTFRDNPSDPIFEGQEFLNDRLFRNVGKKLTITRCVITRESGVLKYAHTAHFMCFVWISEQTALFPYAALIDRLLEPRSVFTARYELNIQI